MSIFDSGNYAYVATRVKAKRSFLYKKETYERLLLMGIPEISRFLGETQYKNEINELGLKYSGIGLIEQALNSKFTNVSREIYGYCKGDLKKMMAAYLQRYDVWNIKTILRGFSGNANKNEILKTLLPAGGYSLKFWTDIINSSTNVEDSLDALKKTEYREAIMNLEWKKDSLRDVIHNLEDELDKKYYENMLQSIPISSRANRIFINFIRKEIDLLNIKTMFKAKYQNVEPEHIKGKIIESGAMHRRTINALVNTDGFKEFVSELTSVPGYEALKEPIERMTQDNTGISEIIRMLEKDFMKTAESFAGKYPISIIPVLDFILRKKIEMDNIRIITRGKQSGLENERIREMIILR